MHFGAGKNGGQYVETEHFEMIRKELLPTVHHFALKGWENPREKKEGARRPSFSSSTHKPAPVTRWQRVDPTTTEGLWRCRIPRWVRRLPRKPYPHSGWRQGIRCRSPAGAWAQPLLNTMETLWSPSAWLADDAKTGSLCVFCEKDANPRMVLLIKLGDKPLPNLGERVLKCSSVIWPSLFFLSFFFTEHNFKILKVFLSNWSNASLLLRTRETAHSGGQCQPPCEPSFPQIIRSCYCSPDLQNTSVITNSGNPKILARLNKLDNKTA